MFVGAIADESFYTWSMEEYERQATKYAELFDMFLDFADEGVIDAILFWGTDDENSWLNTTPKLRRNAALLADRDMIVKPCFAYTHYFAVGARGIFYIFNSAR